MKLTFWLLAASLLLLGDFGLAPQDRLDAGRNPQRPDQGEDPRIPDARNAPAGVKIKGNQIQVGFPTAAQNPETAWKIDWKVDRRYGLIVQQAWFQREGEWIKVLGDSRIAEIHVPYYKSKTYYFDISDNTTKSVAVNDDIARPGKNLENKAVLEVRDNGIMWMRQDKVGKKDVPRLRRSEEIVLWAPLEAGWYLYIVEYRFRDDGSISFRAGSTGYNSPTEAHVTHMHNTIWRLDIDLGQPDGMGLVKNTARWISHKEPGPGRRVNQDSVVDRLFNNGVEGGMEWKAEEFNHLCIVNEAVKNQQGNPVSYDVVPMRTGSARHYQAKEAFTSKDIWVTPFAGEEANGEPKELSVIQLPQTVAQGRGIENTDIVVWYLASALHVPKDEDMLSRNRPGVTMTVWSGFEMRPRNLFSASPHFDRKGVKAKPVQPPR